MKLQLLSLFIIFSLHSKSQNNGLNVHARWHINSYAKDMGNGCYSREDFNNYFVGDSIINGNQYMKLYIASTHQGYPSGQQSGCPVNTYSYSGNLNILIRYHQKKLMIWSTTANQDSVFLDYNLLVGDTIKNVGYTQAQGSTVKLVVTSIDSVSVNGTYLKRLYYYHPMGTRYIMEKIGSFNGLLQPYSADFENGSNLVCYSENTITHYVEPSSTSSCDMTVNTPENAIKETGITIYPNPATGHFVINAKNNAVIKKVLIRNYLGQLISEVNNPPLNHIYNISEFKNGIYFMAIEMPEVTITEKIIKH